MIIENSLCSYLIYRLKIDHKIVLSQQSNKHLFDYIFKTHYNFLTQFYRGIGRLIREDELIY